MSHQIFYSENTLLFTQVFNLSADQELVLIAKCSPAWVPQDQHIVCGVRV